MWKSSFVSVVIGFVSWNTVLKASPTSGQSIHLQSEESYTIDLSYKVNSRSSTSDKQTFATGIVLKISKPEWLGFVSTSHQVRAVLMSFCRPSNGGAESIWYNNQIKVPFTRLQNDGFGYEVQLNSVGMPVSEVPLHYESIGGQNTCRQEIAVVVDGLWLTDPINGSHNFNFRMGL